MMEPPVAASPPKFIIVTHEFAPVRGGAATYSQELAAAMHRAGASVEVWSPDYRLRGRAEGCECPVVRLRAGGTLGLKDTIQFTRAIAAKQAELAGATVLLTSVGAHTAFMLMGALRPLSGRIISVLYGSEILRFGGNPFWRLLASHFYRRVKQVVTVSEFSRSLISNSFLGSLTGDLLIAPCAGSSAAARPAARRIPLDGKVRVLTLARVHPRKGQLDTARALGRLPEKWREQVVYQVGGSGDAHYLGEVKRVCVESGVEFEYLGEVASAQLATIYAGCDLYVMSSRALPRSVEGFGITYLDAGFHGKPVAGYRSGGVVDAVVDGETGLLVADGDVIALAGALERLIGDPALRARLGEGGRCRARQFSWDATARIFQKLGSD